MSSIFTIYRRTMLTQKNTLDLSTTSSKFPSRCNSFSKTPRGFPIKSNRLSVQLVRDQLTPTRSLHLYPKKPPQNQTIGEPHANLNLHFQLSRQVSPRTKDLSQTMNHCVSCQNFQRRQIGPSGKEQKNTVLKETLKQKKWFSGKNVQKNTQNAAPSKENIKPWLFRSTNNLIKKHSGNDESKKESHQKNQLNSTKSDNKILTFSKKSFGSFYKHIRHLPEQHSSTTNQLKNCLSSFNLIRKDPLLVKTGSDTEPKPQKINFQFTRNSCKEFIYRSTKASISSSARCSFRREAPRCQILNLDQFIIGNCKGEGRYGKVYQVTHKKTGWMLALKKIQKETIKSIIPQFINELKLQYTLDHPNITKLYGYFHDEEYIYLLLEYLEDGSLYRYIKSKQKLDEEDTVQKVGQICEAVSFMHKKQILHRDIKPENIVLSHGVCKICDFGWSVCSKTKRKTCCGTLDYTSPQVASGQSYTKQIDVWAIGVLTFEMLTGKPPFYHFSKQKTMTFIRNCDFQIPGYISQKGRNFIQKILNKSQQDRMVKIDELLEDVFLQNIDKSYIL